MTSQKINEIIKKNTSLLLQNEGAFSENILPSIPIIIKIIDLCKSVIFPSFLQKKNSYHNTQEYQIHIHLEKIYNLLINQLHCGFCFMHKNIFTKEQAEKIALSFIDLLPEIKRQLTTDAQAIKKIDPAANSIEEIIFCYPSIIALTHHRIAHQLFRMDIPILPRIITEMAHSNTGIDIHPAAQIGDFFSIDHGTGVVIGATCIIGHHVSIYQGVTLGAKSFVFDDCGLPLNTPRHPIIEDHVTIYSNASILGRITIGHHSVIGSNIRLTESISPNSKITQSQPIKIYES
ncbi:MAG: serine O-acetyltransferase [Chitinophagaceae bacterium]